MTATVSAERGTVPALLRRGLHIKPLVQVLRQRCSSALSVTLGRPVVGADCVDPEVLNSTKRLACAHTHGRVPGALAGSQLAHPL